MDDKAEVFVAIHDWMIFDLHLKGAKLIIYAIIYQMSMHGKRSRYDGGLEHLMQWSECTKRGVIDALKSLIEDGLITKKEVSAGRGHYCEYRATAFDKIKGEVSSVKGEVFSLKGEVSSPKYISNIKEEVSKDKSLDTEPTKTEKFKKPTVEEIRQYCVEHNITGIDPEYFFNYYEANGWVQGKGKPIKSWTACLNTWKRNNFSCAPAAPAPEKPKALKIRIDENGQEVAYYE